MEFDYIKSHTIRGAEALEKVDDLWDEEYRKCARDICMYHHEKWDGSGYPEKLKEDETRKFLENAFREGEVKTVGTDIDKLMPPVSRFGGGNRANKKKNVITRLKAYFDKFYGVGGNAKFLSTEEK